MVSSDSKYLQLFLKGGLELKMACYWILLGAQVTALLLSLSQGLSRGKPDSFKGN